MRQLKRSEYQSIRTEEKAQVIINLSGAISLNNEALKKLSIALDDRVIICQDKAGDYVIGKSKDKNDKEAYLIRPASKNTKQVTFSAAAIVKEMIKNKDLALAKDKKKSIRAELSEECVEWNGVKLYELKLD